MNDSKPTPELPVSSDPTPASPSSPPASSSDLPPWDEEMEEAGLRALQKYLEEHRRKS